MSFSKSEPLLAVILAAGLGKRMNSTLPKVIHTLGSRSFIERVTASTAALSPEKVIIVTGHKGELVKSVLERSSYLSPRQKETLAFTVQKEQKGTGDAARTAIPYLEGFKGTVLILSGDVPLISGSTLIKFLESHEKKNATLSVLTTKLEDAANYGRIVRNASGKVEKIVEAKDADPTQLSIREINSGNYLVDSAFLIPALAALKNDNAQGEFYLTDIVEKAVIEGQNVWAHLADNAFEVLGVNTQAERMQLEEIYRMKKIEELLSKGVEFSDPKSCIIDSQAEVAAGVKIGPGVQIQGASRIEGNVVIEGPALIINSNIGEQSLIRFSCRIEDSTIGAHSSVGPFAHLRPGSVTEEGVKIGNFVEVKQSVFRKGAKASHLSYIGDAEVGCEANIGAGTITCNYDGFNKHKTKIGKNVFIGSNSALVAPVNIGDDATVGAGSVITKDVEEGALAFTRPPQVVKAGWSKRRNAEMKSKKAKK